ncbi:MAG: hypothetical protein CM1200mP29_02290 [Verrucomicrobiota bacterium]|nr:MAG: hypothetical protein CM1200mP29_02290 [Verrucomicrobiota bacterium]
MVYDALVNRELLALAPEAAEVIFGGKLPRDRAIPQDELNRLLAEKGPGAGKTVVRLKGGDPTFLAGAARKRLGCTVRCAVRGGTGISSIIAAPSYAGIPLTHREHCSSFRVYTGHEDPEKGRERSGLGTHRQRARNKSVPDGSRAHWQNCSALEANGLDAGTPVAMVRWGTMGRQQTITGTIATIADEVAKTDFKAPAVTILAEFQPLRDSLNWFENRPLFGQRVVVTRTRSQASMFWGPAQGSRRGCSRDSNHQNRAAR